MLLHEVLLQTFGTLLRMDVALTDAVLKDVTDAVLKDVTHQVHYVTHQVQRRDTSSATRRDTSSALPPGEHAWTACDKNSYVQQVSFTCVTWSIY